MQLLIKKCPTSHKICVNGMDENVYSVLLHPGSNKTGLQRYNFWLKCLKYVPDGFGLLTFVSHAAATQIRAVRYIVDYNAADIIGDM